MALNQFAATGADAQERVHGLSPWQDAWRRLRKNHVAMGALIFLLAMALLAFLTPLLPVQPPRKVQLQRQFAPPTAWPLFAESLELPGEQDDSLHNPLVEGFGELSPLNQTLLNLRIKLFGKWSLVSVFGTDKLGRDVLSRVLWGSRVSLAVGLVAALVSLVIGVTYGSVAGYLGGAIDNLMMRIVDVLYSIPFIFVVIYLISILSRPAIRDWMEAHGIDRITIFFFVVGAIYWLTMARVVRGQIISLKEHQFVEAARTIGAGRARIIRVHLVPNLLGVVIVYLTLTIPQVMLFEAFLSFLGLGVEPPDVSWGLLANEGLQAINIVKIYWWLVAFPSLALALTLFALNFLGDGLRDALDPRMKNR